ncbi:hypothetical protein HDU82_005414 [Entophlyctis luteolus]|nr:hypothetical protein HDU82_005414 [Entophlyctis luteolus]KAJ3380414.1 hypothetical protein HDU84_005936 [Entophlyctis sp. JEL0112]
MSAPTTDDTARFLRLVETARIAALSHAPVPILCCRVRLALAAPPPPPRSVSDVASQTSPSSVALPQSQRPNQSRSTVPVAAVAIAGFSAVVHEPAVDFDSRSTHIELDAESGEMSDAMVATRDTVGLTGTPANKSATVPSGISPQKRRGSLHAEGAQSIGGITDAHADDNEASLPLFSQSSQLNATESSNIPAYLYRPSPGARTASPWRSGASPLKISPTVNEPPHQYAAVQTLPYASPSASLKNLPESEGRKRLHYDTYCPDEDENHVEYISVSTEDKSIGEPPPYVKKHADIGGLITEAERQPGTGSLTNSDVDIGDLDEDIAAIAGFVEDDVSIFK